MRAPQRVAPATLALVGLLAAGCDRVVELELPAEGLGGELGFGVLYGPGERVEAVGEVVRRQTLAAGRYRVRAGAADLEARLALVDLEDLRAAGGPACEARPSALEREACRRSLDRCADDPLPCLSALPATERCGARLELPDTLEVTPVRDDRGGRLSLGAAAPLRTALPGVRACGPEVSPPCPFRFAGYTLLEGGAFRCVADVAQDRCSVAVDLARCGLGPLRGALDPLGGLDVSSGPCTAEPARVTDEVLGSAQAIALTCGERRLVALPMEEFLGSAECARRAPGNFGSEDDIQGRVTGALALSLPGWSGPHLFFAGTGVDECASFGCILDGDRCPENCALSCQSQFDIAQCADTRWASCKAFDLVTDCQRRCRAFCAGAGVSCRTVSGPMLTVSPAATPEADVLRLALTTDGNRPATGRQALAALGEGRQTWLVALTRGRVYALEPGPTTGELETRGSLDLGFVGGGLLARPGDADRVVAFGRELGRDRATLQDLEVRREGALVVPASAPRPVDGLPDADLGALAGRDGDVLLLASTASPVAVEASAERLALIADGGRGDIALVSLPGRPTALAALPGGALALGLERPGGDATVLIAQLDGVRVVRSSEHALPRGLRVTHILPDADRCAGSEPCLVHLALERTETAGPALVGALVFDPTDLDAARLLAAMVETRSHELSLLTAEPGSRRLLAIARFRNVITPLALPR